MINPRFHQMTWRRCWHHLLWWMQSEWWVMNGWNSFRNVQFLCFSLYALIVLIRTVEAYVRNILNKLTLPSLLKLKYAPTHRWSNIFCVHKNRSMMLASIHKSFNEKKKSSHISLSFHEENSHLSHGHTWNPWQCYLTICEPVLNEWNQYMTLLLVRWKWDSTTVALTHEEMENLIFIRLFSSITKKPRRTIACINLQLNNI